MNSLGDYWEALERIRAGKPTRIPKGSPLNKDTVALEAGRKRGAIKKSRANYRDLIRAIDSANSLQTVPLRTDDKIKRERQRSLNYREMYHKSINRELMLIERLSQLEKELAKFENIIPFEK
ncbi:MAG: hypothetical protein ACJAVI_004655 [Candidatus Azotimanducaceae bacterium]|jgi:hypothetical protein